MRFSLVVLLVKHQLRQLKWVLEKIELVRVAVRTVRWLMAKREEFNATSVNPATELSER